MSNQILSFTIPGKPVGKATARAAMPRIKYKPFISWDEFKRMFPRIYTPAKTRAYEKLVAATFIAAYPGWKPFEGPVRLSVSARFQIPKSWSKKKRERHIGAACLSKPDLSNITKAIEDGLNGVAYVDDKQVYSYEKSAKYYDSASPSIFVELEMLEGTR